MSTTRLAAVTGTALAVVVTGCTPASGVGAPRLPPGVSASPSPSTTAAPSPPATPVPATADSAFAGLEEQYDARLGVFAIDTGSGRTVAYRDDERFAYASTIKALAAGAVLDTTSSRDLERLVRYDASDLVPYSPITEKHVGKGMTLRALCEAAVRYSDNTAGNLLFRALGGPAALDDRLEEIGDRTSQVSRDEPTLNEAGPDDPRDTSTPTALATDLRRYVLGDALPAADRRLLTRWLRGSATGGDLVRAGVPEGWQVGDKSGAGGYGTRNDIAVLWPPGRAPVVVAVMSSRDTPGADYDDALIAAATRTTLDQLNR